MNDILVTKEMTTTSRIVAKSFGKSHRDVLRAIDNLDCSEEFTLRNFTQCNFVNEKNVSYRGYTISRDGFSFLCMGFTGKKAAKWKELFIEAFNMMERKILKDNDRQGWKAARLQGKAIRRSTTDTIKELVDYATSMGSKNAETYYANVTRMEYKALGLLEQSKSVTGNFRDTLDIMEIGYLQVAESIATVAIRQGLQDKLHYKDIYALAKQRVTEYAESILWIKLAQQGRITKHDQDT